ncbi:MAG: DUF4345 domain-containing protein [Anaerolineae bacterium]|nr:DUF4345 domain-containing protein [Anaerolineae bacterium]
MPILQLLQIAAAIATIVTGLLSLLRPRSVTGFTGLHPTGPRGITEIRSILGGLFIALGLAPLLLNTPAAYQMLGIAYLGIAIVRAVSMFILDNSVVQSNSVSLLIEIAFGVILVL